MKKFACIAVAILVTVFAPEAAKRKVTVSLDYARMIQWRYIMDYVSECVIVENDSTHRIPTMVHCDMSGQPSEMGDRFTFTVDSVSVESQFYGPDQQKSISQKLTGSRFSIALINGCPVVDTLSTFSVSEISEWDLVIQFAKLLPDIPNDPVRKGYSWERSGVFPVVTSLGKIPCDVYRLYKIDSLTSNGAFAHISWRFRYAALRSAADSLSVLKRVPVSGTGGGTAVVDVVNEILTEATVKFETPVANNGGTKINWVENTSLKYRHRHE
jgi:hypothetical protein